MASSLRAGAVLLACVALTLTGCQAGQQEDAAPDPHPHHSANPQVTAPAQRPTPTASAPTKAPEPSPGLPPGVWEGVGKPLPPNTAAVTTTTTLGEATSNPAIPVLQIPGGSIGCEANPDTNSLTCYVRDAQFTCALGGEGERTSRRCGVTLSEDVPNLVDVMSPTGLTAFFYAQQAGEALTEVGPGHTVTIDGFGCHGEDGGLTCWNLASGHGARVRADAITPF